MAIELTQAELEYLEEESRQIELQRELDQECDLDFLLFLGDDGEGGLCRYEDGELYPKK